MGSNFWLRVIDFLPIKLIYMCAIKVIADATTGKYGSTEVSTLTAMDAVARFARIHAIRGHGKDEYYDSNR